MTDHVRVVPVPPTDIEDRFVRQVSALRKPGVQVLRELNSETADLWHMATGIATEAGELLDAVKATVIYGKPLDLGNVVEELGDLEFYMQGLRSILRIQREEVLDANVRKLSDRYHQATYSNEQAIERRDKSEAISELHQPSSADEEPEIAEGSS